MAEPAITHIRYSSMEKLFIRMMPMTLMLVTRGSPGSSGNPQPKFSLTSTLAQSKYIVTPSGFTTNRVLLASLWWEDDLFILLRFISNEFRLRLLTIDQSSVCRSSAFMLSKLKAGLVRSKSSANFTDPRRGSGCNSRLWFRNPSQTEEPC